MINTFGFLLNLLSSICTIVPGPPNGIMGFLAKSSEHNDRIWSKTRLTTRSPTESNRTTVVCLTSSDQNMIRANRLARLTRLNNSKNESRLMDVRLLQLGHLLYRKFKICVRDQERHNALLKISQLEFESELQITVVSFEGSGWG